MGRRDFSDLPHSRAITHCFSDSGDDLAYNLITLRKPAGIVLSLLFLAISVLKSPLQAQQTDAARVSLLAENKSSSAAQIADRVLALAPTNDVATALKRDIASGLAGKASSLHP